LGNAIRLTASAALKERRLSELLAGRPAPLDAVRGAQADGSLELAGASGPAARDALLRATAAVDPQAPLTASALLAWDRALGGRGFRGAERAREGGPPPAPAALIAGRVAILEQWMAAPSAQELRPAQQGALALARIVEVLPFDDGNGRVSRLAASHLMVRAGARPPILVAADAPRLVAALQAAFQLHTEPLSALLEEAAERALDVMLAGAS
jgi:hypothetical protein